MTPGCRSVPRIAVSVLLGVSLVSVAQASPFTWGVEAAVHGDFTTTTNPFLPDDSRRYFPPSGSVVGQVHWTGPAGVRLIAGAGYEQWVETRYAEVTLVFGPDEFTLEALRQSRDRSLILPLEVEVPLAGWRIAPGVRWQHVVGAASRNKWSRFTTPSGTDEFGPESWDEGEPGVADRWSATIAITRAWRGDAGTRSLGLRWVHGLTDIHDAPDIETLQHALQLVLGWSR